MAARPLKIPILIFTLLVLLAPVTAFAVAENDELAAQERISSHDLYKLMKERPDLLVFDARSKHDYDILHIARAALPLPLKFYNDSGLFKEGLLPKAPDVETFLAKSMKAHPKGARIVTYCNRDCKAAAKLLRMLKRLGYMDVQAMEEGVQAWQELGYPVVTSVS